MKLTNDFRKRKTHSQRSTSRSLGPRVSDPTCQPHPEADAWDPHVSWVKRKKGVAAWFTGLKEEKAGPGWPKKLGSASRTGLVHGSSGRLGSLDRATAHRLPLTFSVTGWARGAVQRLPLTGGARPSVRRRIQCGRTGSGAAAGLCGRVCVRVRLREAGVRRARDVAVLAAVSARGEGLARPGIGSRRRG